MVIVLREDSGIPVYQQVRDQIVICISEGRLQPGQKLPTVRSLAQVIGINSMTVNRAYQLLRDEGYILTDRRNGAWVRDRFETAALSKESRELLQRIAAEAKLAGMSKEEFLRECDRYF